MASENVVAFSLARHFQGELRPLSRTSETLTIQQIDQIFDATLKTQIHSFVCDFKKITFAVDLRDTAAAREGTLRKICTHLNEIAAIKRQFEVLARMGPYRHLREEELPIPEALQIRSFRSEVRAKLVEYNTIEGRLAPYFGMYVSFDPNPIQAAIDNVVRIYDDLNKR
jgi:hypothetical protein